ncbi:MAG: site-specific DNA-methyltransferase [Desulfarculaceae bacterium]|nr:site-specific DNA-methyltransferase [Desulfarculaceae bacterium]
MSRNALKIHKKELRLADLHAPDIESIQSEAARLGYPNEMEYLVALHRLAFEGISRENNTTQTVQKAKPLPPKPKPYFATKYGETYCGDSAVLMQSTLKPESIDLIMTSPPFGLVRKKSYGNEEADQYVEWFEQFAAQFQRVLKPTGSLVIDIGGSWNPGIPTRSLYHYDLLLMLCRKYKFHLAQEFYWWNPAKLPTPAEWVNVRRVRVKDAVNCIWWLSKTPFPKASNRRVLQPYSSSMKHLLKRGYTPKIRPSGHDISDKFQRDNGGAIPPNLIALANTESNSSYQRYCKKLGLPVHPARFPLGIPAFFIKMLTNPGYHVIDPFAGSCMTGYAAEILGRQWTCFELDENFVAGARVRFNEQDSVSLAGRSEPYGICPPNLSASDSDVPLVEDGGKRRPLAQTS